MNREGKRIIAFDIDDTISESFHYEVKEFKKFYEEKYGEPYTRNIFFVQPGFERFAVPKKIYDEFFKDAFPKIVRNVEPTLGAKETIDLLRKNGYLVYIITRRDENSEIYEYKGSECKKDTLEWFKKNNIKYDKIIFSAFDKGEVCKNIGVDVLVDDSEINILQTTKHKINTIIYERPYNKYMKTSYYNEYMHYIKKFIPEDFLYLIENIIKKSEEREVD